VIGVRSVALLCLCSLAACTEGSGGVTRMAGGVRYEGRFVNPEAYAAYLLGVEREAHADYPGALSAYQEAHAEDPDSPEVWARLGAVRCAASAPERGPAAASTAFQRGLANDPEYYGNYLERARCAERARDLGAALMDATAAVARRPDDEPANLLVARLLQALGRSAEARAWLEAFQSYHAESSTLSRALDAARRAGGAPSAPPPPSTDAFAELRCGRAERARAQAQSELDADPTNSDAWIAALVACDALRDEVCFEQALGSLKSPSLMPSQTALGYLRELITRRAGAQLTF
jgi:tetratricopeptide (TPR) repeat protein